MRLVLRRMTMYRRRTMPKNNFQPLLKSNLRNMPLPQQAQKKPQRPAPPRRQIKPVRPLPLPAPRPVPIKPPVQKPPVKKPPVLKPPVRRPIVKPPVRKPPVQKPPVGKPPVKERPSKPPVREPLPFRHPANGVPIELMKKVEKLRKANQARKPVPVKLIDVRTGKVIELPIKFRPPIRRIPPFEKYPRVPEPWLPRPIPGRPPFRTLPVKPPFRFPPIKPVPGKEPVYRILPIRLPREAL